MKNTSLSVVPRLRTVDFDTPNAEARLILMRAQLLRAAVRYVQQSKQGCAADRVRRASDLTGIPRVLIRAAL